MVDFRRCITALAVLALFTGMAFAQGQVGTSNLTCNTNVTVTPQLRGEGYTEQTGDITISCTGGALPAVNSVVPQVNITVFYNTAVTSRLFSTNPNVSEALLLIDEPGSGLVPVVPGFGPAAGQKLCPTPTTGCQQVVSLATQAAGPPVAVPTDAGTVGVVFTPGGASPPAPTNVFQGITSGNAVTFFGIPVLAPGTTSSRTFRITNVRVYANPLLGGSASGGSPVQASISISGATSLLIQNAQPFVGFVSQGLTAAIANSTATLNQLQCVSVTRTAISTLRFTEGFGTAFKTRVVATAAQNSGQGTTLTQNVPGGIYNSESNFVFPVSGGTAGLADFGTRLKATFNNVPAGARIFVSTANVTNASTGLAAPAVPGGSAANTGTVGYAQLVTSETLGDSTAGGFLGALVPASDNAGGTITGGPIAVAEIPIINGTGQAVWEVVNTNPNTIETFAFGVYTTFVSNVASNIPPAPATGTVNLSFAPTPPAFAATAGATASATLPVPRFVPDSQPARPLLIISICRTVLLYPYITNQAGFDTGIAIANTTTDPFGTGAQSGSCSLNWYGGTTAAPTTPPAASTTGNVASGGVYVNTAQTLVPAFQGYMIAICNFQFAHGFAFISDVGARNLAMGYLAVVLHDGRSNTNTVDAENGGH